ncbi:hypothetical protein SAMN05661091_2269 [Paenibacillus uliginis N3/975]|uniref:Uncharacterized protein n=1 Tax=Paenibacillus uliginis N3/975 TaxID=1313296 RepID=A0A1X7HAR7_9BACL|nr:hypothetical protein [Paenibacillus uliginis]SMF82927.1 hypothetical protein SAMN05661091_2269 [Paenibacillus uliginis N3/975]
MLKGWKFSVLGIVIVGIAAAVVPQFGLIDYGRSVSLFILFVLFVAALEIMERLGKRKKG